MIAARSSLGVNRQVFFCSYGGFDTHSDQLTQQVQLLTTVSQSMSAFIKPRRNWASPIRLPLSRCLNSAALLSQARMEERTMPGAAIIWSSEVPSRAVPSTAPSPLSRWAGLTMRTRTARWIPTTALDQYAATLATWFGVSAARSALSLPQPRQLPTSNLGFMG